MMVGQMSASSAIREQLIRGELAAVGGVGEPGLGEQIIEADGDDRPMPVSRRRRVDRRL